MTQDAFQNLFVFEVQAAALLTPSNAAWLPDGVGGATSDQFRMRLEALCKKVGGGDGGAVSPVTPLSHCVARASSLCRVAPRTEWSDVLMTTISVCLTHDLRSLLRLFKLLWLVRLRRAVGARRALLHLTSKQGKGQERDSQPQDNAREVPTRPFLDLSLPFTDRFTAAFHRTSTASRSPCVSLPFIDPPLLCSLPAGRPSVRCRRSPARGSRSRRAPHGNPSPCLSGHVHGHDTEWPCAPNGRVHRTAMCTERPCAPNGRVHRTAVCTERPCAPNRDHALHNGTRRVSTGLHSC